MKDLSVHTMKSTLPAVDAYSYVLIAREERERAKRGPTEKGPILIRDCVY